MENTQNKSMSSAGTVNSSSKRFSNSSLNSKRRSIYSASNLTGSRNDNNRIVSTSINMDNPVSFENIDASQTISSTLSDLSINHPMSSTPRKNLIPIATEIKESSSSSKNIVDINTSNHSSSKQKLLSADSDNEMLIRQISSEELDGNQDSDGQNIDINEEISSNDIPAIRPYMTPWKDKKHENIDQSFKAPNANIFSNIQNQSSPLAKRKFSNPAFQLEDIKQIEEVNANNDNMEVNSLEIEILKKQVTSLKIKNNSLLEIIKYGNLYSSGNSNESNKKNSLLESLINKINNNNDMDEILDKNIALTKELSKKDERLKNLEEQTSKTKEEYLRTLNYADEYIQTSESMAKIVDDLLGFITKIEFKTFNISDDEKNILHKAIDISPNFIMVKLSTVDSFVRNLTLNLQNNEERILLERDKDKSNARGSIMANSTQLAPTEPIEIKDNTIDSNLEIIVQDLHKEYENFMNSIRDKLMQSSKLENLLMVKLSDQEKLLSEMVKVHKISNKSQKVFNNTPYTLSNTNEYVDSTNVDLTKSYQGHIESLQTLIATLKDNVIERDNEIVRLKDSTIDNVDIQKENKLLLRKISNLEELAKHKEVNWNNLTNQLETQITELGNKDSDYKALIHGLEVQFREAQLLKEEVYDELTSTSRVAEQRLSELEQLRNNNASLQNVMLKLKSTQSNKINKYELDFNKFNQSLLIHLSNIFEILKNIIEHNSINQSLRKIDKLNGLSDLNNIKIIGPKLEPIYNFIEMALESIIQSYTDLLIEHSSNTIKTDKVIQETSNNGYRDMQLRIDELQRRWVAERERRKLDSNAAEGRISKLEMENEMLKEQIISSPR